MLIKKIQKRLDCGVNCEAEIKDEVTDYNNVNKQSKGATYPRQC